VAEHTLETVMTDHRFETHEPVALYVEARLRPDRRHQAVTTAHHLEGTSPVSSYFTEAAEITRRYDLEQRRTHHRTPRPPRARTRAAASLRRVADRLEQ
jgi:hypothetical protein